VGTELHGAQLTPLLFFSLPGLPYASAVDPKIVLKKSYMDRNRPALQMSGAEWYSIQAMRAVNQVRGRARGGRCSRSQQNKPSF